MSSLSMWFTSMEPCKPYLAMILSQSIYAGLTLFSKVAIKGGMNPYVFVVYRQAIASAVLAPFAYFFERKKAPAMSFTLFCKVFLLALIGITVSMDLYYVAFKYTTATFAAATSNAIPALTFLMAILLRMERLNMGYVHGQVKVVGAVICITGAFILSLYKGPPLKSLNLHHSSLHSITSSTASKDEWVKGAFLMLTCNAAWALWLVLQAPLMKAYPAKLTLTTLQCFLSALQSAIVAFAIERRPSSWKLNWDLNLLSVVYCGVAVTGLTYWLNLWCIEKKGPVFTAMFTPLVLLITAILSALLWNEPLYWGSMIGGVLIVGGLYGVLWGKRKEEKVALEQDLLPHIQSKGEP
ncbi:WAT1-related protein At1g43650 isoform X1 [Amborella trichopoda]|uniref:WAT1-related protein At1g43650 isoform X1 n=1 Tax=Amborella trichopoda TaxID=13333 RepID=UPI0005D35C81|nr:WAT1-related protein At1g43650 isoform X1 [Amborella trichopoda]|eukprot:XP_011625929.1 WAT1-related protein At1g43650 isoform X1 [Amborella trichopoda]